MTLKLYKVSEVCDIAQLQPYVLKSWEKEFLTFIHNQKQELYDELNDKKDMSDDITKKIEAAIKEFQAQYASGATKGKKKPAREPVAV